MFFTQKEQKFVHNRLLDLRKDNMNLVRRITALEKTQDDLLARIASLRSTVDNHAESGNAVVAEVNSLIKTVNDHSDALELLAKHAGKSFEVKPAVPATVTLTPAEPEELILVKAKKLPAAPKPQPVTMVMPQGLIPSAEED